MRIVEENLFLQLTLGGWTGMPPAPFDDKLDTLIGTIRHPIPAHKILSFMSCPPITGPHGLRHSTTMWRYWDSKVSNVNAYGTN
jgi:hypothetical protein